MTSQEPRNGDFVAYIEQLQRESAARLRAQGHAQLVDLPATPVVTRDASRSLPAGSATPRVPAMAPPLRPTTTIESQGPVLNRQQAEELVGRLKGQGQRNAPRADRPSGAPVVALMVGALLIVIALMADGGLFALFVGIAMVVWGFRRLQGLGTAGAADRRRRHAEYKQRVAQTFGKPPP